MYTIDASVWVNAFDRREPGHETSRRLLETLGTEAIPIAIPNLALAEVAGAVSRTRRDPSRARAFAMALAKPPNVTVVPLDHALANQAVGLAAQHALRGADAVYAAVAIQSNCTLVTLDSEHLTRLASVVATRTPAAALDDLRR